jgi:hypothetical protein
MSDMLQLVGCGSGKLQTTARQAEAYRTFVRVYRTLAFPTPPATWANPFSAIVTMRDPLVAFLRSDSVDNNSSRLMHNEFVGSCCHNEDTALCIFRASPCRVETQ